MRLYSPRVSLSFTEDTLASHTLSHFSASVRASVNLATISRHASVNSVQYVSKAASRAAVAWREVGPRKHTKAPKGVVGGDEGGVEEKSVRG